MRERERESCIFLAMGAVIFIYKSRKSYIYRSLEDCATIPIKMLQKIY